VIDKRLIDELNERVARTLREGPAADVEKNLRALLASWFDRLQLVSREDFDVQRKLLERAHEKLAQLEKRISELESARSPASRGK
jgi:ubiquinone biosynthesis accessory factor UbiK